MGAALVYRQVRWWLLPEVLKKIIISTKLIKKSKAPKKIQVLRTREQMFSDEFSRYWAILGLEIKGLKVVSPEVLAFASELSAIIRTRITSSEAEQIINYLKQLPSKLEAENYLQSIGVPPAATRRLLEIIGIIKKEKVEILEFAKAISEIKGTPLDYAQAEEIMKVILASPSDADNYLKAMLIPEEDRIRLLKMVGIEKKKLKRKSESSTSKKSKEMQKMKKAKQKTKPTTEESQQTTQEPTQQPPTEKEDASLEQPLMTDLEIEIALNEIPSLSPEDKEEIKKYLKSLSSYEEQKRFLDELSNQ
ncbi:MAG: hypothetical protein ACTSRP_02580 [Candidatus Helarchaeota archaeon]